jgi:hypothetical protein
VSKVKTQQAKERIVGNKMLIVKKKEAFGKRDSLPLKSTERRSDCQKCI